MVTDFDEHEKAGNLSHVEKSSSLTLQDDNDSNEVPADRNLERRTVMKLDLLLPPLMIGFYLLAFLDRSNIGNARIAGLQTDLRMSDHQYQIGTQPRDF